MREYNIFISHSWTYGDAYEKLVKLLDNGQYFYYKNYSIPKDDPIHNTLYDWQLENAIREKIKPCSAVVIMAGKYASYSKWIKKEIKIAKELGKPIIAIRPWANEQVSAIVDDNSNELASWNSSSIINAIKNNVS